MYPLKTVLIGLSDHLAPHVRRELTNLSAAVEAEYPDVPSAVAAVIAAGGKGEKRLYLMHVGDSADLPMVQRLSNAFVGSPILALVEKNGDQSLCLRTNRAGATQVTSLPLQIDDFREALNLLALQFGYNPDDTKIVAVTSATGGCGATTIAINLAYEVAFLRNVHTILLELSLQCGMLGTYLNIEPRYTTQDLLGMKDQLDAHAVQQALLKVSDQMDVLVGPHELIVSQAPSLRDVRRLINCARQIANVVVLDIPCTYDDFFFQVLSAANEVVVVVEQKIPAIRTLGLILNTLKRDSGVTKPTIVINKYAPRKNGIAVNDLEKLLETPGLATVATDEPSMTAALEAAAPLRLRAGSSRALADIDRLVERLFPGKAALREKRAGLFSRLMHAFS
jgi:pilus assembly protein CpaE